MGETKEMQIKTLLEGTGKTGPDFTHALSELGGGKMADGLMELWEAGKRNGEVRAVTVTSLVFFAAIGGYVLVKNAVEGRKINKAYSALSISDTSIEDDNDGGKEKRMKCANCGNEKTSLLWDEGDAIYCSLCCHRISKITGEDDSVECPYCHRMRDRKAMYCRHCNDSSWQCSTAREYSEIDQILKKCGR